MAMEKWLGGHPLWIVVQLAIYSVIVGIVLATLGISPFNIVDTIRVMMMRIYHLGFDALGWAGQYFIIGAIVVVPIWLLRRAYVMSRRNGAGPGGNRPT
jgi:Family of unknown function (DUF6460)